MSEIDRIGNSGTYMTLPVAAKRRAREDSRHAHGQSGEGEEAERRAEQTEKAPSAALPRLPKSIIDEFA